MTLDAMQEQQLRLDIMSKTLRVTELCGQVFAPELTAEEKADAEGRIAAAVDGLSVEDLVDNLATIINVVSELEAGNFMAFLDMPATQIDVISDVLFEVYRGSLEVKTAMDTIDAVLGANETLNSLEQQGVRVTANDFSEKSHVLGFFSDDVGRFC